MIQRRMDGTVNFYRPWSQYKTGFGEADGEHWLGLEFIHMLSSRRPHELLVEMEDFEGRNASARYSNFSVGSECDGYRLQVSGFTDGGAGNSLIIHNDEKFSTFDKDQDTSTEQNCAKLFLGAFWYSNCHNANPNGVYRWGEDKTINAVGVEWRSWKADSYSLKAISMKIRPAQ
ncbi:microfibril-associated glycoprotein 4-like [Eucyclogobius newberryi]|uniref:microfibril-associated glycoprotein 4-like n=1 Tax=Eucyclogobius newberryi TaxID=166745 RepID=UPI003B5A27E7